MEIESIQAARRTDPESAGAVVPDHRQIPVDVGFGIGGVDEIDVEFPPGRIEPHQPPDFGRIPQRAVRRQGSDERIVAGISRAVTGDGREMRELLVPPVVQAVAARTEPEPSLSVGEQGADLVGACRELRPQHRGDLGLDREAAETPVLETV